MTVRRSSRLGPAERAEAIAAMRSTELDILVIGGGIVGVGSALDAATRGLSVGLLEQRDFASGTSSRSSKLIHGGIRYLEQLDFHLVREALVERGLLLQRIAPHLVRPVRFMYPLRTPLVERAYIGAGMALYDAFSWSGGSSPGVDHHRHLTRNQLHRAMPSLRRDAFVGGLVYYDAQVDDARYVTTLARTASSYGAHLANRARVVAFIKDGERVVGVEAIDSETGERFEVRAREIVNATGVWTDELQDLAGAVGKFHVRASKGVHIVVPRDRFRSKVGIITRTEKSVLFVIPWGSHWLIGTTDTDWHLDLAHPAATAADIDYILGHVNALLERPLTRADIVGVFAGLRPLLAGESEETSKLSREHIVARAAPGLSVIAGGKFTTYRVMATDAIDAAVAGLGREVPASVTADIPLVGADGYAAAAAERDLIAERSGLSAATVAHLLGRYGALIDDLIALIAERPELAQHLPGTDDYLAAEVVYAVTHEGARHVDDILTRRTRMSIESEDRGVAAAPVVAVLMAELLGWEDSRTVAETSAYLARVAAEIASQEQPDDVSADRVRLEAKEIVTA